MNNSTHDSTFLSRTFIKPEENNIEQLLRQWVVVKFDDHFYPGIVKSIKI